MFTEIDRSQAQFHMPSQVFEPAYLHLYASGELQERARKARLQLQSCTMCPRQCGANRVKGELGVCQNGRFARVSSYFAHFGEEKCLRGWRGSGTIFFAQCNLRCVFCQNSDISHHDTGLELTPKELAYVMLDLQKNGCHNINFVTPDHVVPQILEALPLAVRRGLRLPLVYNTSAYTTVETLQLLDGIVDIYMPDFKFWDPDRAERYMHAGDYPQVARRAIREMHRQVGDLMVDQNGLALRGLLVRHLLMPGAAFDTQAILRFIYSEISPETYVNIMDQYQPAGEVSSKKYSEINRVMRRTEVNMALRGAQAVGLWRLAE